MNTALRMDYAMLRGLDPAIHCPTRLAILTMLRDRGSVGFLEIEECLALSMQNLSNHARKLEDARLVNIGKHIEGRKTVTTTNLTPKGAAAIEAYWETMATFANRSPERREVAAWNA